MRVLRQLDHISLLSVIVVGLVEALVFVPFGARNPSVLQQKPARTPS